MKTTVALTASLLFFQQATFAQEESAQRLFTELTYRLTPVLEGRERPKISEKIPVTGTFWVTMDRDGKRILVTAAHNLGLGPGQPAEINGKKIGGRLKLFSMSTIPLLGTLAYEISEVGFIGPTYDVAFLRPADTNVFQGSRVINLADVPSKLEDRVKIFGFPGTANPQPKASTIVGFSSKQDYMVFGDPFEPGYSGGVVLNSDNKAVGLVIATEAKQASAVVLNAAVLARIKWQRFSEVQTRKF